MSSLSGVSHLKEYDSLNDYMNSNPIMLQNVVERINQKNLLSSKPFIYIHTAVFLRKHERQIREMVGGKKFPV